MKNLLTAAFVCFTIFTGSIVSAEDAVGNINFFFGTKQVSDNPVNGSNLDDHDEIGIMFDVGAYDSRILFALDYLESDAEESGTDVEITEMCIGGRKYFDTRSKIVPVIGMGTGYFSAKTSATNKEGDMGLWFSGGVNFKLAEELNLGVLARWSYADIEGFDAGGFHVGIFAGVHF